MLSNNKSHRSTLSMQISQI